MTHSDIDLSKVTHSIFNKHPTNYQSNLFTESRQEFTELEKKIVVLVVNQIGHMVLKGELKPDTNLKFHIPYTELTKDRYNLIADAADTLQQKRLMYRNDSKAEFHYITPFPSVKSAVVDGRKVIVLTMFADVVPHFAELGQRYTKYDIDVMLSLSSVYAQRMFEIVSMFHNRGQKRFTYAVSELRIMLNCPDTYRYNDFCVNALGVAQRELKNKAQIHLSWEVSKKEGKRVIELTFFIKTSKELANDGVERERRQVNGMSINEAVATAWQLMRNYKLKDWQKDLIASDPGLLSTFLRVDSELNNGLRTNIKNPTAYLIKSIGIDQMKAPAKAKRVVVIPKSSTPATIIAPGPDVRFSKDQKLGDIMDSLFPTTSH
ncbi:replication initiator protein [Spirosoma oryzae]|uniref:Replication initiator protein n=1 Tax=Spirosoma oryzae TaxID=1469603 RepID=A0A2T0SNQ3_9BACT|nr:replication initiation protein [Spirosoma oryzae]PRY35037.1 replication initiator protein [Spirosoma oryzae]